MIFGYIYKTTNMLNGKIYIGQHQGVFDRSYLGSGNLLRLALKKYGETNFKVEPISYGETKKEIDALEIFHISEHRKIMAEDMIYNISNGGTGGIIYKTPPMKGRHHSEESRKKMSDKRKGSDNNMFGVHLNGELNPMFGRKHSDETKKKISDKQKMHSGENHWNRGVVRSQESRAKMSQTKKRLFSEGAIVPKTGWKHTDEARAKMSAAAIRRHLSV